MDLKCFAEVLLTEGSSGDVCIMLVHLWYLLAFKSPIWESIRLCIVMQQWYSVAWYDQGNSVSCEHMLQSSFLCMPC